MALGAERKKAGDAAYAAVLEVASENVDAVVVHGWIRNHGRWLAHAWCEFDGASVVDLTEDRKRLDLREYYATFEVREDRLVRYERVQFFTLVGDMGTLGPFDTELFPVPETLGDPPARA
ncbi:MAG: hypothetical protein H0S85_09400 [Desulfovibrionaceae bacterium]|jgi:hypothetical protein|nr:hypothetical protein [Desulfovibrionaceae bacterium]